MSDLIDHLLVTTVRNRSENQNRTVLFGDTDNRSFDHRYHYTERKGCSDCRNDGRVKIFRPRKDTVPTYRFGPYR